MPYRTIGMIAAVGLVETTYLTAAKLAHVDVICPLSGGCAEVGSPPPPRWHSRALRLYEQACTCILLHASARRRLLSS